MRISNVNSTTDAAKNVGYERVAARETSLDGSTLAKRRASRAAQREVGGRRFDLIRAQDVHREGGSRLPRLGSQPP
jgi:hypothetical protein